MASDNKDNKDTPNQLVKKDQQDNLEEHDLEKNPIQFATYKPGVFTTEAHDKDYLELTLRSGQHSELVKKVLRQKIEARAKEFPRWPGELSSGVRAMWIESRFWYDRERLLPDFDDEWRSYRAKYLHSLELHPNEPVHVPEYEKSLINPLRRFYMKGGDFLEDKFIKKFTDDKYKVSFWRFVITRSAMMYVGFIGAYYWIRYTNNKWDAKGGPIIERSRPIVYPDHPRYPYKDYQTEPSHFCDKGFSRRKIYKDLRDYEDNTVVL